MNEHEFPLDHPMGDLPPDPVIEAYKAGINRTLIRANLLRSTAERMANLVALQRLAEEVRRAGERSKRAR